MSGWQDAKEWAAPELDDEQRKRLQTKVCPACSREFEGFFVLCPTDQLSLSEIPPPTGPLSKVYEPEGKIGLGNLFEVYEGKNTSNDEKVVIKAVRRDIQCEQRSMKPFEREQMIASGLKHKNVAAIFGFGSLPNQYSLRPYIITEYVNGISLATALERWGACDDPAIARQLIEQICEAFDDAQMLGAVHGDVKPNNVYVTADGDQRLVKVVDFAISKRSFPSGTDTRYGAGSSPQSLSSSFYTAPELAKTNVPTAASDVYAIGCIVYELLTGKPPFSGTTAFELAYAHEKDEAAALPDSVNASGELRDSIMLCLSKDPQQRPKSLAQLKSAAAATSAK
ncbi:MAG TPA: serine/threonine-protein kinase [Trichormus sp.]|jgi:serine/threonine-protein kinase